MEQLIPIASKLQDVLGALGQSTHLDLPQIVVVGGQSSGKSSVLEAIVGRGFLPRGHGIVTRRPLVLQLYNTAAPGGGGPGDSGEDEEEFEDAGSDLNEEKKGSFDTPYDHNDHDPPPPPPPRRDQDILDHDGDYDEWGEFLHLPGRRFHSFAAIRSEILRDTDKLTGHNKGIHPTPIHLKIYSPRVLALTLVDLPGLTKVAVGDQPENIEEQIRQMCYRYISNPNAIILAVTGANTDLANSDALKLAREVDPDGLRTIGVLTKLDLMDPGTDASDVLHNRVVPLRRGYVAVVNRGQRDVDNDTSIREGLKNEQRFFKSHPAYGRDRALLAKCGTANLAKTLNNILIHHVRECLPELKSRIGTMTADVQSELDALGSPADGSSTNRSALGGSLLGLLSKFSTNFAAMIDGKGSGGATNSHPTLLGEGNGGIDTSAATPGRRGGASAGVGGHENELYGGARISHIFHGVFGHSLLSVGAFDGLSDDEIRTTICNANGTRPALFVPEMSFDILVRRQISRLEQPGLQCVDLVYEELQRIASQCEPTELTRFPNLRERMVEVVSGLLRRCVGPTQLMVSNLVRIELSYINTSHPDFIGGSRAVAKLMEKMGREQDAARAAARASHNNSSRGGNGGNNNGGVMTPAKGASSTVAEAAAVVGATPLSSSSLDEYALADDGGVGPQQQQQQHRGGVGGDLGNGNGEQDVDASGGGIMNFIFRGGNTTGNTTTAGRGGNGNLHQPTPGRNRGQHGGPPSIVQLPQVPDTMRQTDAPPTDREKVETEIIKSLIESYFVIVRKNFIDMVPKTIMYFLVNHVRDAMQNELVSELYRDAEVPALMREAEDIAQRRKTCLEMKELLTKALEIVNEVRDFNTFK